MTARGLRRIGRHRDHAGVQATKERRDVIRAAGEQQHGAVAQFGLGLQGAGNGARALVELAITEHNACSGVSARKRKATWSGVWAARR